MPLPSVPGVRTEIKKPSSAQGARRRAWILSKLPQGSKISARALEGLFWIADLPGTRG